MTESRTSTLKVGMQGMKMFVPQKSHFTNQAAFLATHGMNLWDLMCASLVPVKVYTFKEAAAILWEDPKGREITRDVSQMRVYVRLIVANILMEYESDEVDPSLVCPVVRVGGSGFMMVDRVTR